MTAKKMSGGEIPFRRMDTGIYLTFCILAIAVVLITGLVFGDIVAQLSGGLPG